MKTYFKATRPDGKDFFSGTVDYAAALGSGKRIEITGDARKRPAACCTGSVLHASDVAAETLVGGSWPCRLFEVTGRPMDREGHKFGFRSLRVVGEIDATLALGPNGVEVAALIARIRAMTAQGLDATTAVAEAVSLPARDASRAASRAASWAASRDASWAASWAASRDASWAASRDASWAASRDASRDASWAACALTVRDLIATEHYDVLTRSLRVAGVTVHPDDPALTA